jgi:TonB family protein
MRRRSQAWLCGVSLLVVSAVVGAEERAAGEKDLPQPEATLEVRLAVAPLYPAIAVAARLEADIEVDADVAEDGTPTSVRARTTHPFFEEVALAAAKQWRFARTLRGGQARITFAFRLLPYDTSKAEAATRFYPPRRIEVREIPSRY